MLARCDRGDPVQRPTSRSGAAQTSHRPPRRAPGMSTVRVARILERVAELGEEERSDLGAQHSEGRDGLEWDDVEIERRVGGERLTIDEAIRRPTRFLDARLDSGRAPRGPHPCAALPPCGD